MQHILAIDYGLKRTGLAFAEKPLYIAHPLETIPSNNLSSYLEKYIVDHRVDTIVIGLPKKLNNTQTDATSHVNTFKNKLSKKYPQIEVIFFDERFSSTLAKKALVEGNFKKSARRKKENVDVIAATIILQDYLKSIENNLNQKRK